MPVDVTIVDCLREILQTGAGNLRQRRHLLMWRLHINRSAKLPCLEGLLPASAVCVCVCAEERCVEIPA